MNKRIKELEKQCWTHRIGGYLIDGQLHFDTEKFAELIVRECQNICLNDDWDEAAGWGKMFAQKIQLQLGVKQHFGVEE